MFVHQVDLELPEKHLSLHVCIIVVMSRCSMGVDSRISSDIVDIEDSIMITQRK